MHNLLLVLLRIVGRIVELIIFLGVCWKLIGVDSELDLQLQLEDQERGWIGLCMKGWLQLTEVGQAELVVLVVL